MPVLATLFVAALPPAASAQPAAPPTREELDIGNVQPARPAEPSRLTVEGDVERGPCPLADPALAQTTVTFSAVRFTNLAAVPSSTLDPAWRDMAGRPVPLATLCDVRDRAATILRRLGYLAAVQIPPQRIEPNGEARMDVLVARLVEVQVRGDAGPSEKLIAAHLAKLTAEKWFNIKQAERHLLLLTDLPGYDVRLTLRPTRGAPGDVVGDVLVKRRPVELSAGIQNLGSRATGREGGFAQLVVNGITGLGDRTAISIFNTAQLDEQTVLQLSHGMFLGSDGLHLDGRLLYARGEPAAGADFKSESFIAGLELSYPVRRSRALSVYATGGFDLVEQSVDFGAVPLSKDKLRVLYGRLSLDTIDRRSVTGRAGYSLAEPRWRIAGEIEARQGIGALGASHDCAPIANCTAPNVPISNLLADPTAFVLRAQVAMEFRPVPQVTLAVSPRAQYSGAALLSYEQFSLGNYTIGRGLDPGIVSADSGAGSSFELRYGKLIPGKPGGIALQPFAFLDAAWAWTHDNGATNDPEKVFSAGGGVRARWDDRMDANLVIAAPLRRAGYQTDRGDVRLLFTIRARLVPWDPS